MCGPLVTTYAKRMETPAAEQGAQPRNGRAAHLTWRDVRQHLLFNLGRTVSYAVIGAGMGLLGALVVDAAAVGRLGTPIRAIMGLVVGTFVVAVGLTSIRRGSMGHGSSVPGLDALFGRISGLLTHRVDRWVRGPRIVGLGMVHGLLPCPILYPAFLYALARGSPVEGALSLTVLGLGTVPTLFAYGTVLQSLSARTRVGLHRVLGLGFVVLGYIPLSHGLMLLGLDVPRLHVPIYQPLAVLVAIP
jgi:sulfite exporter TauE/SafE